MFLSTLLLAILSLDFLTRVNGQLNLTSTYIGSISYGGTGCPFGGLGFISHITGPNTTTTTILLDPPFSGSVPGPSGQTSANRKCQMSFDMRYSSTLQVGIMNMTYPGIANFDSGARGAVSLSAAFTGGTGFEPQISKSHTFIGPLPPTTFDLSTSVAVQGITWSGCGRPLPLNVNMQLSVTGANMSVHASIDMSVHASIDMSDGSGFGGQGFTLGLLWRRC